MSVDAAELVEGPEVVAAQAAAFDVVPRPAELVSCPLGAGAGDPAGSSRWTPPLPSRWWLDGLRRWTPPPVDIVAAEQLLAPFSEPETATTSYPAEGWRGGHRRWTPRSVAPFSELLGRIDAAEGWR